MTTSARVANTPYKKPPITEAVIAIHYSVPLEMKWIDAFARKRKAQFSRCEDLKEVNTSFNAQYDQTESNIKKVGCKLSSADASRVIIIIPDQISIAQMAPYTDWNTLYSEARESWSIFEKIVKQRSVGHVSTRYVNRIDIPIGDDRSVDMNKYFNVGLSFPPYIQQMALQAYHVNCSMVHPSGQYRYVLKLSSMPSPLIDHMSFVIDIDIDIDMMTRGTMSYDKEEMWKIIGGLRQYKNEMFESCITPETRKLFQ